MKSLFLVLVILLTSFTAKASYLLGGSITWKCHTNGQFQFFMEVYRDCSGISFTFQSETLEITGSPLPINMVTSIVMNPDSMSWLNSNQGDLSPPCDTVNLGQAYSCQGEDNGVVQVFHYQSDLITLAGVPPSDGWQFTWSTACCRFPYYANVNSGGPMMLRAVMYPEPNSPSTFPCMNSSPKFVNYPEMLICRNYNFTSNVQVFDEDLDSLLFSFGRAIGLPVNTPSFVSFKPGYSFNNPTPGLAANSNNVSARIDSETGALKLAVYSGNGIKKYLIVQQVDEYRNGHRIASIFREYPISLIYCSSLPNGRINNAPIVKINGLTTNSYVIEVVAGQLVAVPIQVEDDDLTGVATQLQRITMVPSGNLFSSNKTLPDRSSAGIDPCQIPGIEPCAYLRNSTPFIDTSMVTPLPVLKGLGSINSVFVWQTSCDHVGSKRSALNTNQSNHNFVMKVYDDYCPLPNYTAATLTIKVRKTSSIEPVIMVGISATLDGSLSYNWIPPIDSVSLFSYYEVSGVKPLDGVQPSAWSLLQDSLSNYSNTANTTALNAFEFNNPIDPSSGFNILSPSGTNLGGARDFYMRMRTISGCSNKDTSGWSKASRVIELTASPTGLGNTRDSVLLTWNKSGLRDSVSSLNVLYQSKRKYKVYVNDSISNGGAGDSSNWYLVGETYDTSYFTTSGNCGAYSGFRIEAIDTLIILRQGASKWYWSSADLDTLSYSTFSFIDTLLIGVAVPKVVNVEDAYLKSSIKRKSYQWIDCQTGLALPNDTLETFIPQQAGQYRVVVENGGCSDTSTCFNATAIQDTIHTVGIDYLTTNLGTFEWEWVNCNNPSVILDSNKNFVPAAVGSYAVRTSKFGYKKLSNCYLVEDLDVGIQFLGISSIVSVDSNARYQWNKNCLDSTLALQGENGQSFIPKAYGNYSLTLSAYGFSKQSNCFLPTLLDTRIDVINNERLSSLDFVARHQWIDCRTGQQLLNENSRSFVVQDTGFYAVIVSAFGYSDTSECIPMFAVGLDESNFREDISFQPNPTKGLLNIELNRRYQNLHIQIRNLQGQLVQENQFSNTQELTLDIQARAGVYFVELINEKGERANLKVIKQ